MRSRSQCRDNDFPTGTNILPNNNPPSSDTGNSANFYYQDTTLSEGFLFLTDVGAYTLSGGPYGTFDQGGNVDEWNDSTTAGRNNRGGSYSRLPPLDPLTHVFLHAALHLGGGAQGESNLLGFRVASSPGTIGDFNGDSNVDTADYVVWRKNDGLPQDYNTWRANFGADSGTSTALATAIPEPQSLSMMVALSTLGCLLRLDVNRASAAAD